MNKRSDPEPESRAGAASGASAALSSPLIWIALALVLGGAALLISLFGSGLAAGIGGTVLALLALSAFAAGFWRTGAFRAGRKAREILKAQVGASYRARFVANRSGRVLFDNAACRKLFEGLRGDEVVSLRDVAMLEDIMDPADRPGFARMSAAAAGGRRETGEFGIRSDRDGHRQWRLSVRPVDILSDFQIWTIEDMTLTARHSEEQELRDRFMADLLDLLPVGFCSVDEAGNIRFANQTLCQWLEIAQPAEDGGRPEFARFIGELDDDHRMETDATGQHGALNLKTASGEIFPAYLIQSEKLSDAGEFEYSRTIVLREPFVPVVDDGSGQPLIRRIPWLFYDAPVGIVLLDLQGDVVDCNRAFLKLLGLHRDGVVGRPLSERINKEDRSDSDAQLSKVVMGTMPATLLEVRMPAGGERELTASLYVSRIVDDEGDITGLVMHVIDTTEQKNLEVQFNQAQKMQAVGQLAGGVAHDFNNLLTAMIGFCDLLLGRHTETDPSFADIMQIKQNANRAANLVRQLLAFSRRQTLQPKIFSITDALNDLSNLLRRLIGENIELELKHGPDVDLIRTDPGQFDQVVINLAVNARDAMPGGGIIRIGTDKVSVEKSVQRGHEVMPAGEYILITVADTGSGIAKEDLARIFEPFFSTKEVGEGTGLGLSTVYGIIRQSDGYVFVDSALGEGTTFSIYLPAFSAAEATAFGGEIARIGAGGIGEVDADLTGEATVLLVEDEEAVRKFGSRALRNKGYRVLEAVDGEDALDVINGFDDPIDLIISDVVMPGMDGHTLVRLVMEEIPDIKVILMSGHAEDAIPDGIAEDRTINFLPKPFSLNDLAGKVKDVIAN